LLQPLHNNEHVPNFEKPKCFINPSSQRQVHDKMQYLERIADAAFEIVKKKFQYVSDQLELNSKQHQAMEGQFISYLQEHVLSVSTSLVTIFTGGSAPAGILVFCLVLLKQDKRSEGNGTQKSRMS